MYADMDILGTKTKEWYDGSVNFISDQQKFNMKHIYIYSPRYVMIVFPIKGYNYRAIDNIGWPLSTIITKCQYPTFQKEPV